MKHLKRMICLMLQSLWFSFFMKGSVLSMVTEHLSEKMMSSRSSLSDKVFKQCSILLGLLTSLINWQCFVPLQDQPNFFLTSLTVWGDINVATCKENTSKLNRRKFIIFFGISLLMMSKCRMTQWEYITIRFNKQLEEILFL